jgi:molybdate transport system substrate-binding protein
MSRMNGVMAAAAAMFCCGLAVLGTPALAAEINVLSFPPLRGALTELVPQFEKAQGQSVRIEYVTPVQLKERLLKPDGIDVVIATKQAIAGLHGAGRILGSADVAKVGMGIAVRTGSARPEIGSVEAFKRTLLAVRAIGHIDPKSGAPGGIYLAALFEQLGIAAEMKPKTRHYGPSGAETALAAGEVELALSQVPVIMAAPGIDLAGPLPAEIQNYLHFSAATAVGSKQVDAASSLVRFLSSPAAAAVLKAKGFE